MIEDDIIRALTPRFKEPKACWIKPHGDIQPVPLLRHFAELGEAVAQRYADLYEQAQKNAEEFANSYGPDEHIEWHLINEEYEASSKLMEELSNEGYIRCGFWLHENGTIIIEMDTCKSAVRTHREIIKYLCAGIGVDKIYLEDRGSFSHSRRYIQNINAI